MELTLLGIESNVGGCPSLYRTDRDTIVVQGWKLLDAEARASMDIPDHEDAVEVPLRLFRHAPRIEG